MNRIKRGDVSEVARKTVPFECKSPLSERVAAYLADPARTQREQVNRRLTELGFWRALFDNEREDILKTLLQDNAFCEEGKQRFADAVGIERGLYPGQPDLTKAVEVELLISESGDPQGWIDTVNEALDIMDAERSGSRPRARFRIKESK